MEENPREVEVPLDVLSELETAVMRITAEARAMSSKVRDFEENPKMRHGLCHQFSHNQAQRLWSAVVAIESAESAIREFCECYGVDTE